SMGQRGIAARDRTRDPHHLLGRAGLALARRRRGGVLGAAGKAKPVDFADHGILRHISEFRGNLAGRKPGLPEFFQLFDAIVGPGQYRHRTLPFVSRRPFSKRHSDSIPSKLLQAESLSPRRARKARPGVYAEHWDG